MRIIKHNKIIICRVKLNLPCKINIMLRLMIMMRTLGINSWLQRYYKSLFRECLKKKNNTFPWS